MQKTWAKEINGPVCHPSLRYYEAHTGPLIRSQNYVLGQKQKIELEKNSFNLINMLLFYFNMLNFMFHVRVKIYMTQESRPKQSSTYCCSYIVYTPTKKLSIFYLFESVIFNDQKLILIYLLYICDLAFFCTMKMNLDFNSAIIISN